VRTIANSWRHALSDRSFSRLFILTLIVLPAALFFYRSFLDFVETRDGVVLPDPLLAVLPAVDLTWLTFSLVYGGLITALTALVRHPANLLRALQAYVVLIALRVVCMFVVPLNPPPEAIPLTDPVVEFFGASGNILTKDLFFSGHTATMVLLGCALPYRWLRYVFYLGAAAVALCVLYQHVHYTVDVIVAPFVATGAWKIAGFDGPTKLAEVRLNQRL
jgi:hypothetical protein